MATPAKKTPAKKVPAKKVTAPAKTPVEVPAKKTAPRKTAPKKVASTPAPVKTPRKKVTPAPAPVTTSEREFNDHGFVVGTDSAVISEALVSGGASRKEVNAKIAEVIAGTTRNGSPKNIPALVAGILSRMIDRGYVVESSYRLVPPTSKK